MRARQRTAAPWAHKGSRASVLVRGARACGWQWNDAIYQILVLLWQQRTRLGGSRFVCGVLLFLDVCFGELLGIAAAGLWRLCVQERTDRTVPWRQRR
jgi:hypothetical protein